MSNPFFNAADYEWEIEGFYEELLHIENGKSYGVRRISSPTRPLGSDGRGPITLTADTLLLKGPREVLLRASADKPLTVTVMQQPICGRSKNNKGTK